MSASRSNLFFSNGTPDVAVTNETIGSFGVFLCSSRPYLHDFLNHAEKAKASPQHPVAFPLVDAQLHSPHHVVGI